MSDGRLTVLEARLNAHRRILIALAARLGGAEIAAIEAQLREFFPPQDGQEDPGAVAVEAYAALCAYSEEMDFILKGAHEAANA